jgi:hypothetical protein
MEAIREDADRAAGMTEGDLRDGDGEIEHENPNQNGPDFLPGRGLF